MDCPEPPKHDVLSPAYKNKPANPTCCVACMTASSVFGRFRAFYLCCGCVSVFKRWLEVVAPLRQAYDLGLETVSEKIASAGETPPLPRVCTAFVAKTLPLLADFQGLTSCRTPPTVRRCLCLACSTAFAAKTLPLPCGPQAALGTGTARSSSGQSSTTSSRRDSSAAGCGARATALLSLPFVCNSSSFSAFRCVFAVLIAWLAAVREQQMMVSVHLTHNERLHMDGCSIPLALTFTHTNSRKPPWRWSTALLSLPFAAHSRC